MVLSHKFLILQEKEKQNKTPPKKPYASIIILKRFAKERWETKKTVMEGQLCF